MHIIPCKLRTCHLPTSSPLMILLLRPLFISILIPNILLPIVANKYVILAGHFVSSILTYCNVMHHWLVTQPLLFSPLNKWTKPPRPPLLRLPFPRHPPLTFTPCPPKTPPYHLQLFSLLKHSPLPENLGPSKAESFQGHPFVNLAMHGALENHWGLTLSIAKTIKSMSLPSMTWQNPCMLSLKLATFTMLQMGP